MSKRFVVPIDLGKLELLNARIQNLSTAPSSPVVGQVYFDTTLGKFGTYNGSSWDYMGTGVGAGNVTKAANAPLAGTMQVAGGTDKSITDYVPGSAGLIKIAASGLVQLAVAGTDFVVPSALNAYAPLASPTFTGTPTAPDPTGAQGLATKNYVDNAVQGLSWKQAARAIATSNITLSGVQTIDGVSLVAGDRVVVAGQTTPAQNGIYVVASGSWTRVTDADTSAELVNATIYVSEGTANADTVWTVTTNAPITVGTTSLAFAQVNGGTVPVATTSAPGKVQLATRTEAEAKTDTAKAVTPDALTNYTVKKSFNVGDASATTYALTHNLNTRDVVVMVYDTSTFAAVECDITMTSANVVTIGFAAAPALNAYRAVIQG